MKVIKVLLLLIILVVLWVGLSAVQVGLDTLRVVSPGFTLATLKSEGVFQAIPDLAAQQFAPAFREAPAAEWPKIEAAIREAADPMWLEAQTTIVLSDVSAYIKGKTAAPTAVIPVNEFMERFLLAYAKTGNPAVVRQMRQSLSANLPKPIELSSYFPADPNSFAPLHYARLAPTVLLLVALGATLLALACIPLAGGIPGGARWVGTAFLLSGITGIVISVGLALYVAPNLLASLGSAPPDPSPSLELMQGVATAAVDRVVGAVRMGGILFVGIAILLYILAAVAAGTRKRRATAQVVASPVG